MRRLLLPGLMIVAALGATPALACKIEPPDMTAAGRAAAAAQARQWQAELDRADGVFVAEVQGGPGQLGAFAVPVQRLRGMGPAPARFDIGPQSDCSPVWKAGDRLLVYASHKAGHWTLLWVQPDTPAARAAIRQRRASAPR